MLGHVLPLVPPAAVRRRCPDAWVHDLGPRGYPTHRYQVRCTRYVYAAAAGGKQTREPWEGPYHCNGDWAIVGRGETPEAAEAEALRWCRNQDLHAPINAA